MESIFKSYIDGWSHLFLEFECTAGHIRADGPDDICCALEGECYDGGKFMPVTELEQFSAAMFTLHEQMIQQKNDFEEKIKSLENNYNKILEEINNLRKAITDSLDELEKNTIKKLDTLRVTTRGSIQGDIYHCTKSIKKMTCLQENLQTIIKKRERKTNLYRMQTYRKCLKTSLKTEAVLKEMKAKNEVTLTFNPDTLIQQTLSTLSGLGQILQNGKQSQTVESTIQGTITRQSDHDLCVTYLVRAPLKPYLPVRIIQFPFVRKQDIIKLEKSKMFRVRMTSDSHKCLITGICETAAGLLILDTKNRNMKLLDKDYKVVAHCKFPGIPESMCSIDSSLVAVTVCNSEVHFIRVTNGQLVQENKTLKPEHFCKGIAHHKGNLYIASGTALYQYTTDGRQVCKIYEEKSCYSAVTSCAVTSGAIFINNILNLELRIYVANQDCSKLLTLLKDGTVISTLTDPALKLPSTYGHNPIHVTGSGQVLVCNADFNTVLQVDIFGRRILAEVVKGEDDLRTPLCIYSMKHTGTLVVGMMDNDNIMVFTKCNQGQVRK